METMETLVLSVHVLVALAIIGLVLIQQGKGADAGAGFGGGASNTVFGSLGAGSFLSRLTTAIAVAFFLTSFGLAYFAKQRSETISQLGIPTVIESVKTIDSELPEFELPDFDDSETSDIPED